MLLFIILSIKGQCKGRPTQGDIKRDVSNNMINVNHSGHVLLKTVISKGLMVHIYLGKSVQGVGGIDSQFVCLGFCWFSAL